ADVVLMGTDLLSGVQEFVLPGEKRRKDFLLFVIADAVLAEHTEQIVGGGDELCIADVHALVDCAKPGTRVGLGSSGGLGEERERPLDKDVPVVALKARPNGRVGQVG